MVFENRNDPSTIRFSVTRLTRMYRRLNAAAQVISRLARFHLPSGQDGVVVRGSGGILCLGPHKDQDPSFQPLQVI